MAGPDTCCHIDLQTLHAQYGSYYMWLVFAVELKANFLVH